MVFANFVSQEDVTSNGSGQRNDIDILGAPSSQGPSETCGSQEFLNTKNWGKDNNHLWKNWGKLEKLRKIANSPGIYIVIQWFFSLKLNTLGWNKTETMRRKVNNTFLAWIFLGLEKPTSFWVWGDLGRFSIGSMKCVFVGNVGAVCHDFFWYSSHCHAMKHVGQINHDQSVTCTWSKQD